jgi:hypothetical protein
LVARRFLRQLGAIATLAVLVALALTANAGAADGGKKVKKTKKRTLAASVDFVGTAVDNAHVKLQWGAVPGAASYRIVRGGVPVGQTAATTYTDALLWLRTTYSYEVDALTPAGTKLKALLGQGTTASSPASGFPRPFPATSVWNTPVGSTPVSATSAAQMQYFLANAPHPNMTLREWGVAVTETHQDDSLFSVPCTRYSNCTLSAFGSFRIPSNAVPDPSDDGYMTVFDPGSQREWDMWQASRSGSSWSASAGAALSTAGNGTAPAGTASGDAANFPLLAGIVRPEEIAQGHIDHALVFGMPHVSGLGHVCPATHNDGSSTDPNALMEGAHLQLDPSVDVDALPIPTWQKTIAKALQAYGMYLRDQGGSFVIYAENPVSRGYDAWAKAGMPSGGNAPMDGIPWSKLRVLSAPSCS